VRRAARARAAPRRAAPRSRATGAPSAEWHAPDEAPPTGSLANTRLRSTKEFSESHAEPRELDHATLTPCAIAGRLTSAARRSRIPAYDLRNPGRLAGDTPERPNGLPDEPVQPFFNASESAPDSLLTIISCTRHADVPALALLRHRHDFVRHSRLIPSCAHDAPTAAAAAPALPPPARTRLGPESITGLHPVDTRSG